MMESSIPIADHNTKEECHEELNTRLESVADSQQQQQVNHNGLEEQLVLPALSWEDSCDHNAEFAVICSFLARFGELLDLSLNIEQLKASLENQIELHEELINLHVKLLKKTRRYFVRDQWEKALIEFTGAYSYGDACELESFGYLKTRPSVKIELLGRLLDVQFECDQKFKAAVNAIEESELRVPPIGRDVEGNTYWHEVDSEGNIRVFHEKPMDYKSWNTVCRSNNDLEQLIKDLEQTQSSILKGKPTKPYNPLPLIFPDIFRNQVNKIESNDDFDNKKLDDSIKFEHSDDESTCDDEDETNVEPVIVKRARTARQSLDLDASSLNQTTIIEDDTPCRRCDKSNDPEWILLCDMCDDGYHTSCCIPPLVIVPDGDWYCPACEHKMLLTKLKDVHFNNSLLLKIKERERAKIIPPTKPPKACPAPVGGIDEDDDLNQADLSSETESESVSVPESVSIPESELESESDSELDSELESEIESDAETEISTPSQSESETSIDELIDIKGFMENSGGVKKKVKKRTSYESDDSDWHPS